MSFVVATPEVLASAATQLLNIGSSLRAAHAAVATPTTAVAAAAADEVSTAIAGLFSAHGNAFQSAAAQVSELHTGFAQALRGAGATYLLTEAANALAASHSAPLQAVFDQAIQATTPDLSVSFFGMTLVQSGSATTWTQPGSIAIAYGAHSHANALDGTLNFAIAVGPDSTAQALHGFGNIAVASGSQSSANAGNGNGNIAAVLGGQFNHATATNGSSTVAIVNGLNANNVSATATPGNAIDIQPPAVRTDLAFSLNGTTVFQTGTAVAHTDGSGFALAFGPEAKAVATGEMSMAVALGSGSNYAYTNPGFFNIAAAIGHQNTASTYDTGSGRYDSFNFAGAFGRFDRATIAGGTGNIALALGGEHLNAVARGIGDVVVETPPVQALLRLLNF